ncbi:MAG: TIGR02206 family membrane protein [Spirochaetales bacterium]|nr:TIGR02206 family membrane protein [Spirochaetales bacterium]
MYKYFSKEYLLDQFSYFSYSHIMALIAVILVNVILVVWLKRTKNPKTKDIFCYCLSALLLLQEISYNIWLASIGEWSIGESLPLHLCGMAIILSPVMLIKKNYHLYEIIYFWGMAGAFQALLTPGDLHYGFPHYRFFQFFLSHALIVIACLYMTFVEGFRPKLSSVLKTIIVTNIYLVFIALFNLLVGGNYMFLCHPPKGETIISLLGEWPWYILGLELVGSILIFLFYVPFLIKDIVDKVNKKEIPAT